MFELSPLVTRRARRPRRCRPRRGGRGRSRSRRPCCPLKRSGSRRNARRVLVDDRHGVPGSSSAPASSLPTRPHPTTTTCTGVLPPNERRRMLGRDASRRAHRLRPRSPAADGMLARRTGAVVGNDDVRHSSSGSSSGGRSPRPSRSTSGIPKTIALAVFSSDAISSTAYATEEILFVTAVGALEPRARPRHAGADRDRGRGPARDRRHVVPPDDLRLPERRRRRTSSAARTSARCRRWSPARRCSSTTSSPSRCRSRPASPPSSRSRSSTTSRDHRVALGARADRADHASPTCGHQGVGPALRGPDVRLHRRRSSR